MGNNIHFVLLTIYEANSIQKRGNFYFAPTKTKKYLTLKFIWFNIELAERVRAFSSVGRASPLQGEGQKFESSNAHFF